MKRPANPRRKPYRVSAQIVAMRRLYPQFKVQASLSDPRFLTFIGQVQAHETLPVYTLKISYRHNQPPLVQVLAPELVAAPPHFYADTQSLCLYHPRDFVWQREVSLATEIVPRAVGWVYFYEKWLQSGEWFGDEASH